MLVELSPFVVVGENDLVGSNPPNFVFSEFLPVKSTEIVMIVILIDNLCPGLISQMLYQKLLDSLSPLKSRTLLENKYIL